HVSGSGDPRGSSAKPDSAWRELPEVVDPETLLQARDLVDHRLEAVLAEQFVLLLFEVLAKRRVFVLADDLSERREQHRVFTSLMWPIHPIELANGCDQLRALARVLDVLRGGELRDEIGDSATRLV